MQKSSLLVDSAVPCVELLLAVGSEYIGLDLWLSRQFYDPVLGIWPYKAHCLTETLLHKGGRLLVMVMAATVLLSLIGAFFRSGLRPYRKDLAFVLIAGLSGPAIVGGLKTVTHIYSPWDLQMFVGRVGLLTMAFAIAGRARRFATRYAEEKIMIG